MNLLIAPPPDLRPWLEAGLIVDCDARLPGSAFPALVGSMVVVRTAGTVQRMPDGAVVPSAAFIGPATRPCWYRHQGAVHAVGLLVWPEAVSALWQGEAPALVDAVQPLSHLPGGGWSVTADAVLAAADDRARLALLFGAVRGRVSHPRHDARRLRLHQMDRAVRRGIEPACATLGIGRRQLERQFKAHFGMAPKPYQRIARLKDVLGDLMSTGRGGADLALRHGYWDQSHLARDLRELAGATATGLRPPVEPVLDERWALSVGTGSARPAG